MQCGVVVLMNSGMRQRRNKLAVTDLTSVLNFIFFTSVRWKNDKNVQLSDFLSKIGQCFPLRNNHEIKIVTVSMCL